ncbi:MAG: zinc carboxypeptidase [Marinilabiliales bacterium]|nr:MAG: zinc carboxypeptidase [Marinilabiliales bacterium]
MKKYTIIILIIFVASLVYAQMPEELKSRKEIFVEFKLKSNANVKAQLEQLNKIISISDFNSENLLVEAYVSINNYDEFTDLGIDYTILTPPSMLLSRKELDKDDSKSVNDWNYYPNWSQYNDMMQQFADDYPEICELVNIGQSQEGRDILFLHIGDSLDYETNEPEFMYTSSIHGDELTGYVLTLRLADYLLSNYGNNDRITNMVDNIDIWINPLANPDGTFAGGNNSVYGATRFNANGVDMNRNYPDPEDGPHPDGNAYQVATTLFMDFAEERDFVMAANFHGGAEVMNFPWDTWAKLAADDDWWYFVSREYADTVHLYAPAYYMRDLDNGVTNGYQWYSISGGRQDYMNYFHHCREVTAEISSTKLPSASQLPDFWEWNYRSLLNYMEQVLYGVRGVVTNASNGNTIKAKVFANAHDIDESFIYSTASNGNYSRLLKTGLYSLTFSAFGYNDKTIPMVTANDYQTTLLNVQLDPITSIIDTNKSPAKIYPNQASDYVKLEFNNKGLNTVQLIDIQGKVVSEYKTTESQITIPLQNIPAGKYIISIKPLSGNAFVVNLVVN